MAHTLNKAVVIARIAKPFGIKGWLYLDSFTDPAKNILDYDPWYIEQHGEFNVIEVESAKPQNNRFVVKFKEIDDRTLASHLTNKTISIDSQQLPRLDQHEFYWHELEGMEVINLNNKHFGCVSYLFATGANDVIVVKGEDECLIPYVKDQIIKKIDRENKKILVDWDNDY